MKLFKILKMQHKSTLWTIRMTAKTHLKKNQTNFHIKQYQIFNRPYYYWCNLVSLKAIEKHVSWATYFKKLTKYLCLLNLTVTWNSSLCLIWNYGYLYLVLNHSENLSYLHVATNLFIMFHVCSVDKFHGSFNFPKKSSFWLHVSIKLLIIL